MTAAIDATARELTPELADLMEHEKVIEQGLAGFIEVGNALMSIKIDRKYRAAGYATFEVYCQERWGISREHGRRLVVAAATTEALANALPPNGGIPAPSSEGQIRPLGKLDSDDDKAEAWSEAVEEAREGGRDAPTEKDVQRAVDRRRPPTPEQAAQARENTEHLDTRFAGNESPEPAPIPPPKSPPKKRDVGGGIHHPAPYSDALLDLFRELLEKEFPTQKRRTFLDPFAGTGRIHELSPDATSLKRWRTVGVEIEPEWADLHPRTQVGSALDLPFDTAAFDAIVTSPTYGNRLADSHNARDPEARRSYTHDLGRKLADDNSGAMQWGEQYRDFHRDAWAEAVRVLNPGGVFLLNIKDHIRNGVRQQVSLFHLKVLWGLGMDPIEQHEVPTRGLMAGANHEARAGGEMVYVLRKENA